MTLQTRREYAASLGLAKAGARGRLSREANAAIEKAMSEGVEFSDVELGKNPNGNVKVVVVKRPGHDVVDIPEYFRDIDHEVYELVDGKRVHRAMSCVCLNDGVSLVLCHCDEPRITSRDGNPEGVRVYFGRAGYGDMRFK